jgi:hypothetical protein
MSLVCFWVLVVTIIVIACGITQSIEPLCLLILACAVTVGSVAGYIHEGLSDTYPLEVVSNKSGTIHIASCKRFTVSLTNVGVTNIEDITSIAFMPYGVTTCIGISRKSNSELRVSYKSGSNSEIKKYI